MTSLSYSLSVVGFYMLFQLFLNSQVRKAALTRLVGVMAAPVLLKALGDLGMPGVVATNYEPIGVPPFALGTLYFAEGIFERVRWSGHRQVLDEIDDAILLLDDEPRVYQYNAAVEGLFPTIAPGDSLDTVFSAAERNKPDSQMADWGDGTDMLILDQGATTRYYLFHETDLTVGPHRVARAIVLTDVTCVERQRSELERYANQLEGFSAAVAHELRNSLMIIAGHLTLLANALDAESKLARDRLDRISDATGRMIRVIGNLTTM